MAEGGKRLQTFSWDWIECQLGKEAKEQNMQVVRRQQKAQEILKGGLRKKHELVKNMEAGQEEVRGRKKNLATLNSLVMLRRQELVELHLAKTPAAKQNLHIPALSSSLSGPPPLANLFQPPLCSSPLPVKQQAEVTSKKEEGVQVISLCFQPLPAAPRKGILKTSRTAPRLELQWEEERRSKRSRSEEEVKVVNGDRGRVQFGCWDSVRQGEDEQARKRQYIKYGRKEELEQLHTGRREEQIRREQQLTREREQQQQMGERRRQQGMVRLEGHQSIRRENEQEIAGRRQVEHEVIRRMMVEQEKVREEQRAREEEEKKDRDEQELDKERAEQIIKQKEKQEMIERLNLRLERERIMQQEEVHRVRQVRLLLDQEEEMKIANPEINLKQAMNQTDGILEGREN